MARLDLAAILILAVLLVAALGSCFPQLSSAVAADPERFTRWAASVRARYGPLADFLAASGAFSTSNSAIFLVPLALLATVTFVCTLNRWQSVWRRAFDQRVHCSDLALDTAPYKAGPTTLPTADLPKVVRESLEQRGFRVRKEDVGDFFYLRGDRNGRTPLATLVTHLAALLLLLGTVLSSGYGWREEITIGPGETVEVGHESALAVRNDGFTVVRYPNGSAADYEAEITVVERSQKNLHGLVRINEPLTWRSIGFHLRGYTGIEGQYSVILLAVRDPGYGLVIASGFLLLLGLTVSFNFPHCWVHVRVGPEGTLRLAGRTDRQACDFGREFAALAMELERTIGG